MITSSELKQHLVTELQMVISRMEDTPSPIEKAYFYSAAYGAALRVLSIEPSPKLVHLFLALQTSYAAIDTRIIAIKQKREEAVTFPSGYFDRLCEVLTDLTGRIDAGRDDLADIYEKLAVLMFAISGPGHSLLINGRLKL